LRQVDRLGNRVVHVPLESCLDGQENVAFGPRVAGVRNAARLVPGPEACRTTIPLRRNSRRRNASVHSAAQP
jgi:hypothetical protein